MNSRNLFLIIILLSQTIICFSKGTIVIFNGPPCVGKSTTATELQKALPGSELIRMDEILRDASHALGVKYGLFTDENPMGPDNKYGYNGLTHFIQYVREHRECTDQELNEMHDLRLIPYQKVASFAQQGSTVIFDGSLSASNERFNECLEILKGNNIVFVLMCMSIESTAKRYACSGRGSHGILHVLAFNFPWLYRAKEKDDEPIIDQFSHQELTSLIRNLKQDIPSVLLERCIKEVEARFELYEDQQITLTPRMYYDLIIDVQHLSVQDCVNRILDHLNSQKVNSTRFFDNAFLPLPSNSAILKVVPKLSPKYLS